MDSEGGERIGGLRLIAAYCMRAHEGDMKAVVVLKLVGVLPLVCC